MAHEGAQLLVSGLSTEVVETILQSIAPSTRKLYALKWKLFTSWCGQRLQDPVNCPVGTVLEFLQVRFSAGLSPSTLKVYMASLAAYHALLSDQSLGRHPLVTRFLYGSLRLRPVLCTKVPSWDLAVVLEGLCIAPFESIEEVPVKFLMLNFSLLFPHLKGLRISRHFLFHAWNLLQAWLGHSFTRGSGMSLRCPLLHQDP